MLFICKKSGNTEILRSFNDVDCFRVFRMNEKDDKYYVSFSKYIVGNISITKPIYDIFNVPI